MVIPGVWAQHTPDKASKQCSWLKLLVASTDNDTRVFIFKYDIENIEDGSVWHQLLALARDLMDALRQARPFEVCDSLVVIQVIKTNASNTGSKAAIVLHMPWSRRHHA